MSRFNQIEKFWGALSRAASAALGGETGDPGWIDINWLLWNCSAGYVSGDEEEEGGEGEPGGEGGQGGDGGQGAEGG